MFLIACSVRVRRARARTVAMTAAVIRSWTHLAADQRAEISLRPADLVLGPMAPSPLALRTLAPPP